jgi:hypothetical protein
MMLEIVCGALALCCAGLLIVCLILVNRVLGWRQRYAELVAKPFAFWEARERNRRMMEALSGRVRLDGMSRVPEMPPSDPDKVVQFRRP